MFKFYDVQGSLEKILRCLDMHSADVYAMMPQYLDTSVKVHTGLMTYSSKGASTGALTFSRLCGHATAMDLYVLTSVQAEKPSEVSKLLNALHRTVEKCKDHLIIVTHVVKARQLFRTAGFAPWKEYMVCGYPSFTDADERNDICCLLVESLMQVFITKRMQAGHVVLVQLPGIQAPCVYCICAGFSAAGLR